MHNVYFAAHVSKSSHEMKDVKNGGTLNDINCLNEPF